jgi:hypothetical protein
VKIYLYINATLYLLFAIWCTLAPSSTARNLGYVTLANAGRSEYLVIYGGLQLGLAMIFFMLARSAAYLNLGIVLAIALYAPIVLYRMLTVARNWPVGTVTIASGCLEALLLIGAVWLYYRAQLPSR